MSEVKWGFGRDYPQHWAGSFPEYTRSMIKTWGIGDNINITSQCGQAELIYLVVKLLGISKGTTYLDIGANDGVTGSSTFLLDQAGWLGLCVEPQCTMSALIQSRSVRTKVLTCAISKSNGIFNLLTSKDVTTLATLETTEEIYRQRLVRETDVVVSIPVVGIESAMLYKYFIREYQSLTFLKVDCEGSEKEAIEGLQSIPKGSRPIFIEYENNYRSETCAYILKLLGYEPLLLMDSFCEIWFLCEYSDEDMIKIILRCLHNLSKQLQ